MKARLKNQKGFTLIELMLVITIVILLATIAIPNYMTYQAKARQTEAKANLGGIFINEQAYYSEQETYSNSFYNIGFGLAGTAKYYDFTLSRPPVFSGRSTAWDENAWIGRHGTPGDGPAADPSGADLHISSIPGVTPTTFTCLAVGNIDNDPSYDVWTGKETGEIVNEYNDVLQ